MSDLPPPIPPSNDDKPYGEIPKIREAQSAEYYRNPAGLVGGGDVPPGGSAEKLEALWAGYKGLNGVFVVNILLSILLNGVIRSQQNPEQSLAMFLLIGGIGFIIICVLTYPQNRKIGFGKGWSTAMPVVASVLMGLNSVLCCGIIGYLVMQQIAAAEIKLYGLKPVSFKGFRKEEVAVRVEQLRVGQGVAGSQFRL